MEKDKPDHYNSLDKTYLKIWNLLELGLKNRNAPFHLPIFISGKQKEFSGRIVVIRGINKKEKKIHFHTDIRSNKVTFLKKNSICSLLFYDKAEKVQLRISGKAKINYKNKLTETSWKKTAHMSRQCYLGNKAPGSDTSNPTSGLTEDIDNSKYTLEESEIGYKNFCVVETFITTIEWLYLAAKGHRRAHFAFKKNAIEKKWLIP